MLAHTNLVVSLFCPISQSITHQSKNYNLIANTDTILTKNTK